MTTQPRRAGDLSKMVSNTTHSESLRSRGLEPPPPPPPPPPTVSVGQKPVTLSIRAGVWMHCVRGSVHERSALLCSRGPHTPSELTLASAREGKILSVVPIDCGYLVGNLVRVPCGKSYSDRSSLHSRATFGEEAPHTGGRTRALQHAAGTPAGVWGYVRERTRMRMS